MLVSNCLPATQQNSSAFTSVDSYSMTWARCWISSSREGPNGFLCDALMRGETKIQRKKILHWEMGCVSKDGPGAEMSRE